MSTKNSLAPLKKTQNAVLQIRKALTPYLKLLKRYHDAQTNTNNTPSSSEPMDMFQITQAEAAVALSIGTLRFIAARLKGQNTGKGKNDPLRMELDKMRKTLVELRMLEQRAKESKGKGNRKRKGDDDSLEPKRVKK